MGVGLKEQKKHVPKYLRNELLGKEKTHTQTRTHVSFWNWAEFSPPFEQAATPNVGHSQDFRIRSRSPLPRKEKREIWPSQSCRLSKADFLSLYQRQHLCSVILLLWSGTEFMFHPWNSLWGLCYIWDREFLGFKNKRTCVKRKQPALPKRACFTSFRTSRMCTQASGSRITILTCRLFMNVNSSNKSVRKRYFIAYFTPLRLNVSYSYCCFITCLASVSQNLFNITQINWNLCRDYLPVQTTGYQSNAC